MPRSRKREKNSRPPENSKPEKKCTFYINSLRDANKNRTVPRDFFRLSFTENTFFMTHGPKLKNGNVIEKPTSLHMSTGVNVTEQPDTVSDHQPPGCTPASCATHVHDTLKAHHDVYVRAAADGVVTSIVILLVPRAFPPVVAVILFYTKFFF